LCDLPPTVLGELALKWFEAVQTQLPMCAASAVFGPLDLPSAERAQLRRHLVPWAVRSGRKASPLITVMFEEEWETPLSDLRVRLRLDPAPTQ
jgi:ubiquinone biosynthesis protein COQ4